MGRRMWAAAVAGVATLGVVVGVGMQARSQEDAFRLLSGALVGEKAAYIPLPVVSVSGAEIGDVSTNFARQDALISVFPALTVRSVADLFSPGTPHMEDERVLRQMQQDGRIDLSLLLWSEGSRKAATVWRGGGNYQTGMTLPLGVNWFSGTRIALVQIITVEGPFTAEQLRRNEAKATMTLLRVNGATGKTQPVTVAMKADAQLIMSPHDPVGAVVSEEGEVFQAISATGTVGAATKISGITRRDGDSVYWFGWLPGGKTLRGSYYGKDADGKSVSKRLLLDTVTGIVTEDTTPKGKRPSPAPDPEPLPFLVHQGRETLTREGVKTIVYPLWLEGRDKELTGRTLIAADSEPNLPPVVLQTAILYRHRGGLYAVPILKSNSAEFIAQRQAAFKAETIRRAKQVGLAVMMYAQDYDENFPPIGAKWGDTVNPYVKDPNVFSSPVSGLSGFTPVYKLVGLTGYESPATTPLGYIEGPGGRAVVYIDGHVKWEDTPGGTP